MEDLNLLNSCFFSFSINYLRLISYMSAISNKEVLNVAIMSCIGCRP